ncbi:hypothetical protein [Paenibacillus montanisoli]|uniref:Uncharacterized protein n=1 Tax=Paenibacillus montanisoli TaxID=2081970 RepID=A0A328TXS8_9BACL|nr:hypothetical protein [Paenibacillus montanisoli]RAP74363.1 hypothetical protein DL346_19980 [Paenibacillus montanisoli]
MRNWTNIQIFDVGGGVTEDGWNFCEASIHGDNNCPDDKDADDFTHLADVRVIAVENEETIKLETRYIFHVEEAAKYDPVSK